jgi:hypothetical protein
LADAHKDCAHAGDTNPDPDTVEHHFICYIHKDGQLYEIGMHLSNIIVIL